MNQPPSYLSTYSLMLRTLFPKGAFHIHTLRATSTLLLLSPPTPVLDDENLRSQDLSASSSQPSLGLGAAVALLSLRIP